MAGVSPAYESVLQQVRTWPPERRLGLAQAILNTLAEDLGPRPPRRKSLRNLLGLLQTKGPAPTDEECRRMLEEELLKKHGS